MAKCYICDSDRVGVFRKDVFIINNCRQCGLRWVHGMKNFDLEAFYSQTYFNNQSKMGYKDYLADEDNHRKNSRNILETVNKVRDLAGLRVLDIGCAFGYLLDEAKKKKGCDAYGVEVSGFAYDYAVNNLGLENINRDWNLDNFESGFFDVVFLIGTIEHIIEPKETLRQINRILKPEGLLVITTIDTKGILPLYSLKPPEHVFYFSHNNLKLLLDNTGFCTLRHKPYFVNYYFHDLIYRLSEFSGISFLKKVSGILGKRRAQITLKIPTNEMIVVAKKALSN